MAGTLTEADVLFELMLPMLCEQHAAAIESLQGEVCFLMEGEAPRSWTLTFGQRPWLRRGATPTDGTATVRIAERFVRDVVHGRDDDFDAAVARGEVAVSGDPRVLAALGHVFVEARSALGVMLHPSRQGRPGARRPPGS